MSDYNYYYIMKSYDECVDDGLRELITSQSSAH